MTYPNANATIPESGPRLVDGAFLNANGLAGGFNRTAKQLTALAGGAAPGINIALMDKAINEVNVVASNNDSVQLPSAQGNMELWVVNSSANTLRVYSNARSSADTINGTVGTTPYTIATGKAVCFFSPVAGKWFANLSA